MDECVESWHQRSIDPSEVSGEPIYYLADGNSIDPSERHMKNGARHFTEQYLGRFQRADIFVAGMKNLQQ
jgi:hypothetical protein